MSLESLSSSQESRYTEELFHELTNLFGKSPQDMLHEPMSLTLRKIDKRYMASILLEMEAEHLYHLANQELGVSRDFREFEEMWENIKAYVLNPDFTADLFLELHKEDFPAIAEYFVSKFPKTTFTKYHTHKAFQDAVNIQY